MTSDGIQIVPSDISLPLDANGDLPSGNYLYLSTGLSPFTLHVVTINRANGQQVSRTLYSLSETSPGICNLTGHLQTFAPAPGLEYNYFLPPGIFWAAVPWKKT